MPFTFIIKKNLIAIYGYVLIFMVSIVACGQPRNHHMKTDVSNVIPDSICYYFPEKYVCKIIYTPLDISERSNNPSTVAFHLMAVSKNNIDIERIQNFAINNSIQILDDNSEIVILKDRDFDKRDLLDSTYIYAQISNIIPDFCKYYLLDNNEDSLWADTTTKTGLKPGYTLYVIKSGSTLVLNEKWDCNRKWLPAQLRHGYRSGIAINPDNEYVIFWCVAW